MRSLSRHRRCLIAVAIFASCVVLLRPSVGNAADPAARATAMLAALSDQAGLCVHVGVRDAGLVCELARGGEFLVHGLTADASVLEQARRDIRQRGLAGAVSIEHDPLNQLPYSDNLVNLLVVDDLSGSANPGELLREVLRVLRPEGVAFVMKDAESERQLRELASTAAVVHLQTADIDGQAWFRFGKPRPASMDEWTHRRYDATRNAVSRDKVNIPTGVRWVAGPNWPTGDRKASVPGVVASKDRLVYVFDDLVETADGTKRQNKLVARDAYNGMLLWQRPTSSQSPAVLVHIDNRIYTVVQDNGPLVALDARTGENVATFNDAGTPQELFVLGGRLLARTRSDVRCVAAGSGELQWRVEGASDALVGNGRVFLQTSSRSQEGARLFNFVCVDLSSGKELWRSSSASWPAKPTSLDMILYQDGIVVFGGEGNHAISAEDGSYLWSYNYRLIGHGGSFLKVVHMNDLLWIHNAESIGPDGKPTNAWEGLDPKTGQVAKRLGHGGIKHRCMYDVATERYFLCGSMDFVDLVTEEHTRFAATRNSCRAAGVVPANGLVYTFPHGCACYPLLRGFLGLAAEEEGRSAPESEDRQQRGPAFGAELVDQPSSPTAWATYRGDAYRSSSTTQPGPMQLKPIWERALAPPIASLHSDEWDHKEGGRLTSPVVADGLVLVAACDTHELVALDADTGEPRWHFTAGGRIDCPPTVYRGLCLFGARDGWVYCLRASDGQLVWRYRAAPDERRIVAYGQLESRWPVVGGVLVHDGLAYFAAGRHGASDGGVHVYAANPASGEIVWHDNPAEYATLPDLLVAGEHEIHMADWEFDAKTGKARSSSAGEYLRSARLGLLNDIWYKRPLALRKNLQQWSNGSASGQLLAFNREWICGFTGPKVNGGNGETSGDCQLFAKSLAGGRDWSLKLPLGTLIKGMVLADQTLFVAGRLDGADHASNGVRELALDSGKPIAETRVTAPVVHEPLAVNGGRAYLALQDGRVICFGAN